jgi:hypothetical protein
MVRSNEKNIAGPVHFFLAGSGGDCKKKETARLAKKKNGDPA